MTKTIIISFLLIAMFALGACNCCKNRKEKKTSAQTENLECQDRCKLEPNSGNCKAYLPRYYFDKEKGACAEFIWGGCNGVVPFNTLEECEACNCN